MGDLLFQALMSQPVRSLFDQSIGKVESPESPVHGLRLRLNLDPSNPDLLLLYSLPWELTFWKERGEYLCLSQRTSLVRAFDVPRPARSLELKGDLRILVAMASPRSLPVLDLKREQLFLNTSLSSVPGVDLHFLEHATPEALRRRLSDEPFQVLHFMGHGSFDPATGEGALAFENGNGDHMMLSGSVLADLVRDVSSLRLALLNACDTARTGRQQGLNPFAGVATALVLAGLPAVVAMQFPISDEAAIAFSEAFYRLLAAGKSVDTATAEGRMAIRLQDSGSLEWATPVLFLRAANRFYPTSSPSTEQSPALGRERREPQPDLLDRYRRWALERYRGMSLLGVGGGDLGRIRFEQVYVPLRIARRPPSLERERRGESLPPASDELGIEQIFSTANASNPHVLLLGEPGAGKTTGLLKLLHQCLSQGPESLGLEEGTLVIFLRLRRLSFEDLDHGLDRFVQRELERELGEVAGGKVPAYLGARLWEHKRLLLLCDGLDEIADETLRVRTCEFLDWELTRARPASLRAVVSCRFAGYRDRVRLGESYSPLEVRPLDARQSRELVRHWFREAQHGIPDRLAPQEAIRIAEELVAAMESPGYGSQRWKVLVGSPLLLTLLCVIVLRGGHMPLHRVSLYDQCLRVLLGPWSHGRREGAAAAEREPPVDIETALAVLRALAWRLHTGQTWDGLSVPEGAFLVRERLAQLGRQGSHFRVFDWLHREAGVLEEYATGSYGFLHLGVQEYLTALEVASQGGERLDELCGHAGEEWWQEVFLLLVGLPGHAIFAPLLERLLGSPALLNHADLVRACLEEASEPAIEPFLARLGPEGTPEQQAVVLRLLRGWADPRLLARVRALCESPSPEVGALARQVAEEFVAKPAVETSATHDVFVLHHPEDRAAGAELARILSARGWQAAAAAEDPAWQARLEQLLAGTRAVVLPIAADGRAPWEDRAADYCLRLFSDDQCPLVAVRLPATLEEPEIPGHLPVSAVVDLRGGWTSTGLEALDRALSGGISTRSETASVRFEVGQSFVEPITGCRLLWVSGGRFRMGGRRYLAEQPVHGVRVSPFWIGETPVTNRQFSNFLDQTGHEEPCHWRDRRFSGLEQPVVGVCWDDAQAFCQWLADATGQRVTLPSEAQWEFSARGSDGREFPWGSEPPDSSRACYNLRFETGQPVPVGSYPAGKGPFGTLDQAGNVREWCLDVWSEKVYSQRALTGCDAVSPVVDGEGDQRVLRGGGWFDPPEYLRAAYRSWYRAKDRYGDFGFRIAAAP